MSGHWKLSLKWKGFCTVRFDRSCDTNVLVIHNKKGLDPRISVEGVPLVHTDESTCVHPSTPLQNRNMQSAPCCHVPCSWWHLHWTQLWSSLLLCSCVYTTLQRSWKLKQIPWSDTYIGGGGGGGGGAPPPGPQPPPPPNHHCKVVR